MAHACIGLARPGQSLKGLNAVNLFKVKQKHTQKEGLMFGQRAGELPPQIDLNLNEQLITEFICDLQGGVFRGRT